MEHPPVRPPDWRIWFAAARPGTLWAAVAPVVVGVGIAFSDGVVHPPSAVFAVLGAVLIQVGTNLNNDYQDFLKGADAERVGPLRVTQAGLVAPEIMRNATIVAFALAAAAGAYLMWRGGWPIITVGVLSILCGFWYTSGRYSLAYLGISDLFVLVFFGPVAVGGTYYVQALTMPWYVPVAGLGPGALATAILLVNNVRDVEGDRKVGKRTLVVRLGRKAGVGLYAACLLMALIIPIVMAWTGRAPLAVVVASAVVLPGFWIYRQLGAERDPQRINPLLGRTAQLLLVYSIVLGISWTL
jgi:1,4-dihydroxy-2-naphthoate polyprenyltransferase